MKSVRVVRCPKCGSTDAGCNEALSIADISYMQCNGCGNAEHCDTWQISFDWNVDIELPDDATELPSHVAPLAPGTELFADDPDAKGSG